MRNCGKARRARKAIMLDNSVGESIIEVVGGEDKALLRSNPSARTDAGIAAEGYSLKCLPPPVRSNDPGHKAANLGVWGGAPIQKTVFSACPACHLARSPGLNRFRAYSHGLRRGLQSAAPAELRDHARMTSQPPTWRRLSVCRVPTHRDAFWSTSGRRPDESGRGTHECVRHMAHAANVKLFLRGS